MHSETSEAVALPVGLQLSENDREIVKVIAQAIAGLHPEDERAWKDLVDRLERDGWDIDCHVAFVAEGRRRGVLETAVGRTRDEAIRALWDLSLFDAVEGCP